MIGMMVATKVYNPVWFLSRATGMMVLVLLTVTVVLGMVTAAGWRSRLWPRFVSERLHRNTAMLAFVLLILHIVTTVLHDSVVVHMGWRDALIPFGSWFRPVWVGFGVVAAELMVGIAIASALRERIGARSWRLLHWGGYGAWILAVIHSVGTGSDSAAPWSIALTAGCVLCVLAAVAGRLASEWRRRSRGWAVVAVSVTTATMLLANWAAAGPLAPDWASRAGSPPPAPTAPPFAAAAPAPWSAGPPPNAPSAVR